MVYDELPGEADVEQEIIEFQGRVAWEHIDKKERELDAKQQERIDVIKQRQKARAAQKRWDLAETKKNQVKGMEERIKSKKENVESLMKHMNVGAAKDILINYKELLENKEKIKDILIHYKKRVEEVEGGIKDLQTEYNVQKYEVDDTPSRYDTPAYILKVQSMLKDYESHSDPKETSKGEPSEISKIRERIETFMKSKSDKPEQKEETVQKEHEDQIEKPLKVEIAPERTHEEVPKEKTEYDTDALVSLENKFSASFKDLLKKEADVKRMSNLINNSCLTVSRIIYQLESNVKPI